MRELLEKNMLKVPYMSLARFQEVVQSVSSQHLLPVDDINDIYCHDIMLPSTGSCIQLISKVLRLLAVVYNTEEYYGCSF